MEIEYDDESLRRLAEDTQETGGWDVAIVKAYRKRVQFIQASPDERAFWNMRSLHYEKLKHDREGQFSMRLNDQWRLILRYSTDSGTKRAAIIEITDYH